MKVGFYIYGTIMEISIQNTLSFSLTSDSRINIVMTGIMMLSFVLFCSALCTKIVCIGLGVVVTICQFQRDIYMTVLRLCILCLTGD